jgi:hypothetical protein
MSGGHFEYVQYTMRDFAREIRDLYKRNGKGITWDPKTTKKERKEIMDNIAELHDKLLWVAVSIERLDYILSGDDGTKTYLTRYKEDMEEITGMYLSQLQKN